MRTLCLTSLILLTILASSCGGRADDLPFGVDGDRGIVINEPTEGVNSAPKPLESRFGNVNLIDARMALRELAGASDARRTEIFDTVISMGPEVLVEIDRAAATERDESALLAIARMRMILVDIEEAERAAKAPRQPNPADPNTINTNTPNDPSAATTTDESTTINPSVPSTYGITPISERDIQYDVSEVDKFVHSRLILAMRLKEQGEITRCVEICEALLLLVPGSRWRREIQQVLRDAKTGEQALRHIAGTLKFDAPATSYAASGDGTLSKPLPFSIFLKNVSGRPLKLSLGNSAASGREAILVLELEVFAQDATGQTISTRGQTTIRLNGGTHNLAPDEAITIKESLASLSGLSSTASRRGVLATLKVTALLRLESLHVNLDDDGKGEQSFRPVSLMGGEVYVLPSGFDLDDATSRPISFLRKAIEDKRYDDLYLAAPLIGEEHRQACLDILLDKSLEECGLAEQQSRIQAARVLTKEDQGKSPNRWTEWWSRNRHRFGYKQPTTGAVVR